MKYDFTTMFDALHRDIPDYYPTMYLDGYEPWQIQVAFDRQKDREVAEYYQKKEEAQKEAAKKEELQNVNVKGVATLNGKRI